MTAPVPGRDRQRDADAWESHRRARRIWAAVLVFLLAGPALLWAVTSGPQPVWHELSEVTGLVALSALVVTATLPSRVRGLSRALGLETLLDLHRQLGVVTGAAVALHLACVIAADPSRIGLLLPLIAPARAQAAVFGSVALGVLLLLALRRHRSSQPHEIWRWVHLVLAAAVVGGAALHVLWLGNMVADPLMGPVLAVLGLLLTAVLVLRWGLRGVFEHEGRMVVRAVRRESATVSTLVLAGRSRHASAWFRPGQFAWLRLERYSVEEHPFTIASSAHEAGRVEFTLRHTGDFADRLRRLPRGSTVWVDGPYGSFTTDAVPSAGYVLIAGGVGITPMMSMLRTAADRGDPRPYRLVVHARDRADLLFRAELSQLRTRLDLEVTEVLRRPELDWDGATGPIDTALLAAVLTDLNTPGTRLDYFICGRPSLVTDVLNTLAALGVPNDRVHTEQFAPL
ncbi:ferredoxin reductase family protein [Pseudonocardia endophytica]|uniref:Putative ferric reductase n=1 Tax=Pseudonocardia endophytica TaxID=401976 RepID=A0A4R1HWX8_PSEEN|nr:ferric reductase-like transmembrane domain-containing protein [Pseudonocardia endophytica]TCK27254.1 putative ferric reductase [Pseudonocardia endophytica]